MQKFDVIIIGSGPGGEGTAMKCVKSGKLVALVDERINVGGACTHTATIPSKAIRFILSSAKSALKNEVLGKYLKKADIQFSDLLESAKKVITSQIDVRSGFYQRNNVEIFLGRAKFIDEKTIEVITDKSELQIQADSFVVATGSSPYHPPGVNFDDSRIFDSDTILSLKQTPRSITIYGAGVIGCEYASIFRNLDVKVNLVNTRDQLLDFLDDEIVDALAYHLRDQGVLIRHNEEFDNVKVEGDSVVLALKSGKKLKTDIFLWANGRSGNSANLGLENLGIKTNSRGSIEINEAYQTIKPHIYAVGDVTGFPSLASAAYDQGRFAATHLVTGECNQKLVDNIPTGIYTSPEISSVGKTEQELTRLKVPYEVGHAMFRSLARAQIVGTEVGMLKLLFHRETLEILGIHCFGYQASEIIHIGQAIMAQKDNSVEYFVQTTFNYPTMAEAYRVAALNGLNRIS